MLLIQWRSRLLGPLQLSLEFRHGPTQTLDFLILCVQISLKPDLGLQLHDCAHSPAKRLPPCFESPEVASLPPLIPPSV